MAFLIVKSSLSLYEIRSVIAASFVIMMCSSGLPKAAALGNETDRRALLAFKDGVTSDPLGALRSWNESVHFCHWAGVTCGRRHQRVFELRLDDRQLKGHISPHIGNMSFLKTLFLRNNSLEQQIPPQLGRLRRLQTVSLRNNSIGGEIPVNISGCSNLIGLDLRRNNLEGVIPAVIGISLSKLQYLDVGQNHLTGIIPATLVNLSSLRYFYASVNEIHGFIPDQFGNLKKLERFYVQSNKLVGTIPPSLFNISSITSFVLQGNQLTGSLPSQLGGTIFPNLDYLDLGLNLFHGTIPVSISNASKLGFLDLGTNNFTGKVPSLGGLKYLQWISLHHNFFGSAGKVDDLSFLSSLTNISLEVLSLNGNNFGGELPHSIGNISTTVLYLHNNEISGSIPKWIGNLFSLQDLRLDGNEFTGNVPSTMGKLTELRDLDLSRNRFSGTIPVSLGNLSSLVNFYFAKNNLEGTIPSSLGKCNHLWVLSLYLNNLHGTIPVEIFSIFSLSALYLNQNHLSGFLPPDIGHLINLEDLRISDNRLSGKVPNALGSCIKLNVLLMDGNNLRGILPSSLSSLRGLGYLDLSRNNFSGNVPDYLAGFNGLQYLNLSFNDFEGVIPERGIFKNIAAVDVKGNTKLCGGIPQLQLKPCSSKGSKHLRRKLVIALAVGFTVVALLLCFLYLYLSKKSPEMPSVPHLGNSFLNLSYQDLREATNGFSTANLIGNGSFGSVYKGLHQGQQMVAIKVLNLQRQGASRSFMAECEALRKVRHRNLVKVFTACSSIDHQGNDFKALVYEYMVNGCLDNWLHSHENQNEAQADSSCLNISQRLDIAIDVASALEYLHHRCEDPIVHCDLKPSNILLDEDLAGHVGDFGLAKFLREHTHQLSESQSNTIGVRGTVGYVAPEYGIGNEVSISGDVYSYGILLLELFTGKRPTDHHEFSNCLNLHDYVKMALHEGLGTVADSRLFIQPIGHVDEISTRRSHTQNQGSTSCENIEGCLVSLLEVGIASSRELPGDRMTINEAISQLHAIKKTLLETCGVQGGGRVRLDMQS